MISHFVTNKTVVFRASDIVFTKLDDELLAIDSQAGYCYSINETAGRIWEIIETPHSIDELCSYLRKEYLIEEDVCLKEVIALVERLNDAGLVQVKDAHSEA